MLPKKSSNTTRRNRKSLVIHQYTPPPTRPKDQESEKSVSTASSSGSIGIWTYYKELSLYLEGDNKNAMFTIALVIYGYYLGPKSTRYTTPKKRDTYECLHLTALFDNTYKEEFQFTLSEVAILLSH
ncbi:hypothetical protein J3Q64DRAFT_1693356 [Phycomyces blakesleeanus]|uniref:Uncharacterized protein n=2 Tax=Phycomyces blakesleeanus TaxID=4837 RepID=A0A162ZK51_PHYB8|nr:hypothetical protein PHYBLDRAFT_174391 [Phycomyces blakesleeanus NRRL 1555(-)]OAD67351.1 hypothetical protein PHYBLDRAFT_174391 [Phycomyces blakesleeanus NRRL 1555(-)]|eukprot:XP_018285391.1 hypothetical protein PHYBLDRAFT_174391 [Phycomyces blakesleeanus NRRL 1555(-)]